MHAQAAAIALALVAAPATAQQWLFGTEITGRDGVGLAYDVARAECVLFGGNAYAVANGGPSNDTWLHDGTEWRLAAPVNRPPARSVGALAHDTMRAFTAS